MKFLGNVHRFFRQHSPLQRFDKFQLFRQELKTIDPKTLAATMGNSDAPPEEPLFSSFEEGFGYFSTAAVGRSLVHYEFVRKVRSESSVSVVKFDPRA